MGLNTSFDILETFFTLSLKTISLVRSVLSISVFYFVIGISFYLGYCDVLKKTSMMRLTTNKDFLYLSISTASFVDPTKFVIIHVSAGNTKPILSHAL